MNTKSAAGVIRAFFMPNLLPLNFEPGKQIYSPGESCLPPPMAFNPIPWPNTVETLATLASHPGVPRAQADGIFNNSTAELPSNFLFIGGFVGKSQG